MSIEIKVPMLPESVSDATMMDWHVKAGDAVKRDQNLVDLETEKVVLEVPAPEDGVLKEIRKQSGDTVTSGEILAILEAGAKAEQPAPADAPEAAGDAEQSGDKTEQAKRADAAPSEPQPNDERLSPAVRRLVAEHDLDPAKMTGTGKDGRITKEDVLNYFEQQSAPASEPEPPASTTAAPPPPAQPAAAGERSERREPMTRLRRTIAARLVEAQQNAAILTTFNEVDLGAVIALRKQYKEAFEKAHGARLGFMSFFVKAAVEALRRFPAVNAYIDGTDAVYHDYCDVGIAVSSPRGLVVPVVRDAERRSFAEIEAAIAAYGDKARKGTLSMDDLTGGTFTITNGGVFGSLLSAPILNPPQSAILGMHKIEDRPMAVDGAVVIRPMMYLALSYDHRLVDGREAVSFLVTVKDMLEEPARLLLEV